MKIEEVTMCRLHNNPEILKFEYKNKDKPETIWFQTQFKSHKGTISLIHLGFSELYDSPRWEIYCIGGKLFEDIERFETLMEAMDKIKEYLE